MSIARFKVDAAGKPLDPEGLKAQYRADGIVVIENLIPAEETAKPLAEFEAAMRAALDKLGADTAGQDVDALYKALWRLDPAKAEVCMGLGRDLPAYYGLVSSPRLRGVMSLLLDDERHMLAHDFNLFRIDGKETQRGAFDWHQDYPYNVLSLDAITFWLPVRPVTAGMGGMKVVKGSHDRLRPVRIVKKEGRFNPNSLSISVTQDEVARWESEAVDTGPIDAGSVILFDCKLLHRSAKNESERFRWIVNGRYGRIADDALMARDWYTVRTKHPLYFMQAHPDLVVEESEAAE